MGDRTVRRIGPRHSSQSRLSMTAANQTTIIELIEGAQGDARHRSVPICDDALRSVVRAGGVAVIDEADFCLREGYVLLDLGGMHLWRVQKTEDGWRISTDDCSRPARHLSNSQMNAAYIGRAVRVWSPV